MGPKERQGYAFQPRYNFFLFDAVFWQHFYKIIGWSHTLRSCRPLLGNPGSATGRHHNFVPLYSFYRVSGPSACHKYRSIDSFGRSLGGGGGGGFAGLWTYGLSWSTFFHFIQFSKDKNWPKNRLVQPHRELAPTRLGNP